MISLALLYILFKP